jgi:hypothetical protein
VPKRIMVVFGIQPECNRLAPVVTALQSRPGDFGTTACSSLQHQVMLDGLLSVAGLSPPLAACILRQPKRQRMRCFVKGAPDRITGTTVVHKLQRVQFRLAAHGLMGHISREIRDLAATPGVILATCHRRENFGTILRQYSGLSAGSRSPVHYRPSFFQSIPTADAAFGHLLRANTRIPGCSSERPEAIETGVPEPVCAGVDWIVARANDWLSLQQSEIRRRLRSFGGGLALQPTR